MFRIGLTPAILALFSCLVVPILGAPASGKKLTNFNVFTGPWNRLSSNDTLFGPGSCQMCNISTADALLSISYPDKLLVTTDTDNVWYMRSTKSGALNYGLVKPKSSSQRPLVDGFICPTGSHLVNRWDRPQQQTFVSIFDQTLTGNNASCPKRTLDARYTDEGQIASSSSCAPLKCLAQALTMTEVWAHHSSTGAKLKSAYRIGIHSFGSKNANMMANITLTDSVGGIKTEIIMCEDGSNRRTVSHAKTGRQEEISFYASGDKSTSCKRTWQEPREAASAKLRLAAISMAKVAGNSSMPPARAQSSVRPAAPLALDQITFPTVVEGDGPTGSGHLQHQLTGAMLSVAAVGVISAIVA